MQFRPCIDIHNGKVKQIVGSTLKDDGESLPLNYNAITGVYLGAEMSEKSRGILLSIIERSGFSPQIWQSNLSKNSYELEFSRIS